MKTPNLNRKIQIQQQTASQLPSGQLQQTWSTVRTCWANIDIQNSALIYSTDSFVSKVTHRITIRFSRAPVIEPKMRLMYQDAATGITHTYTIEAVVNPQQGNVFVILLCYELDANE